MLRGIPTILAALLFASGCAGTRSASAPPSSPPAGADENIAPPGYASAEANSSSTVYRPRSSSKREPLAAEEAPPAGREENARDPAVESGGPDTPVEDDPSGIDAPDTRSEEAKTPKSIPLHEYLVKRGQFASAISAFRMADEGSPELRFRYDRLAQLLDRVGLGKVPSRQEEFGRDTEASGLARKAVDAFMNERDRHAVLFAAAATGSDPETAVFGLLLQALEAWTSRAAEAGERQAPDRVVAYKLRRANALFEMGRYEDGAGQCLEALLLEPANAGAYERLGSMYYAMGARERAVGAWRESLRIRPGNDALKDFMARLESDGPKERTP
jgi:hypothetical protein